MATDDHEDDAAPQGDPGPTEHDRYARAKRIFLDVRRLPEPERPDAIASMSGGDERVAAEVRRLLEHDLETLGPTVASSGGTGSGATPLVGVGPEDDHGPRTPARIGPYRVLHELARGGMGIVYRAVRDDDTVKKAVAIKVLKRGTETDEVLARFRDERDLHKDLTHPAVAQLFDAGETDDGRPYFVMEFVEGTTIDRYCDANRLGVAARLRLFQQLCEVVQYLHENLVIHRDIKPSNVLVTADGRVKLLDFGIAKYIGAYTDKQVGDPTAPDARIMTPEYASPEQVDGRPLSTRTDIYSLGVMLYELLSGHQPYALESRARAEVERVLLHVVPDAPSIVVTRRQAAVTRTLSADETGTLTPESVSRTRGSRPDTLRRQLAGDVDNIVMRAMRKEPERRYASADDFRKDIERHLVGLPVEARPDRMSYRLQKFVQRNKGGVAAAAAVLLAIVLGAVVSALGWSAEADARDEAQARTLEAEIAREDAETARDEAEAARDEARESAERLERTLASTARLLAELGDVESLLRRRSGTLAVRVETAEAVMAQIDALLEVTPDDADLLVRAGRWSLILGEALGGRRSESGGDRRALLDKAEAAEVYFDRAVESDADIAESILVDRVAARTRRADALDGLGRPNEAYEQLEQLERDLRPFRDGGMPGPRDRRRFALALRLGDTLSDLAVHDRRSGDLSLAQRRYEEAVEIQTSAIAAYGGRAPLDLQRELAPVLSRYAAVLFDLGEVDASIARLNESVEIVERLLAENPADDRWLRDRVNMLVVRASRLADVGRPRQALDDARIALSDARVRAAENPGSARTQVDLVIGLALVVQTRAQMGECDDALLQELLEISQPIREDPSSAANRIFGAVSLLAAAQSALVGRRMDQVESLIAETMTLLGSVDDALERRVSEASMVANAITMRAAAELAVGAHLDAFAAAGDAREAWDLVLAEAPNHPGRRWKAAEAIVIESRARLYEKDPPAELVLELVDSAIALVNRPTPRMYEVRARALHALGRSDEARLACAAARRRLAESDLTFDQPTEADLDALDAEIDGAG